MTPAMQRALLVLDRMSWREPFPCRVSPGRFGGELYGHSKRSGRPGSNMLRRLRDAGFAFIEEWVADSPRFVISDAGHQAAEQLRTQSEPSAPADKGEKG